MKATVLVWCALCMLVMGFQCPPDNGVTVPIDHEAIGILVAEVEGGIEVTNTSTIAVIVFVRSPEGEQQFELDIGDSVTVTGITEPIEVTVVGE